MRIVFGLREHMSAYNITVHEIDMEIRVPTSARYKYVSKCFFAIVCTVHTVHCIHALCHELYARSASSMPRTYNFVTPSTLFDQLVK